MDSSKFQKAEGESMTEVRSVFKEIFAGKTLQTEDVMLGFFADCAICAKVEGNKITFAMPFNGPITLLCEILKKHKYNKSNTIFADIEVNDDNTLVTAEYFTKEFKMFDF